MAADAPRLRAMQASLQAHAADVLWEAPNSRVGTHALALATRAVRQVCASEPHAVAPAVAAADAAAAKPATPGPQITFAPVEV